MGINSKNDEVIRLLMKSRNINAEYPWDMWISRRQGHLKHMAELGLSAGTGMELQRMIRSGVAASRPPQASGSGLSDYYPKSKN